MTSYRLGSTSFTDELECGRGYYCVALPRPPRIAPGSGLIIVVIGFGAGRGVGFSGMVVMVSLAAAPTTGPR